MDTILERHKLIAMYKKKKKRFAYEYNKRLKNKTHPRSYTN